MSIRLPGEDIFLSPDSFEGQYDQRYVHKIILYNHKWNDGAR